MEFGISPSLTNYDPNYSEKAGWDRLFIQSGYTISKILLPNLLGLSTSSVSYLQTPKDGIPLNGKRNIVVLGSASSLSATMKSIELSSPIQSQKNCEREIVLETADIFNSKWGNAVLRIAARRKSTNWTIEVRRKPL